MSISVILPNYNGQNYLATAIESILSQDYLDFEFLIIDDGSTDASKEIINKYANYDKRIKPFFLDKIGLANVLNFGIESSNNEFIARMDSDDVSLPDRFSSQLEYFKNAEVGLVGTGTYIIDYMGKFIKYGYYPCGEIDSVKLLEGNYIAHPTVMFRRDLTRNIGLYSPKYLHAEDYEFWLRISQITKIVNTEQKLLIYRQHESNVSLKNYPHQQMTDLIIKVVYKNKINLTNKNFNFVNFELIKEFINFEEYSNIKYMWKNSISSMINSGKLKESEIQAYFLSHLNHDNN
jgi:glycosyltransferase involved in cell wall biosynthesis